MPEELVLDPAAGGTVHYAFGTGAINDAVLPDAIPAQQSTRGDDYGNAMSAGRLTTLAEAARLQGVDSIRFSPLPTILPIGRSIDHPVPDAGPRDFNERHKGINAHTLALALDPWI